MSDLPSALRADLETAFVIPRLAPERVVESQDGTCKLLFRLDDGEPIEAVLIPDEPRLTLCVSSQAGCGMGCGFCATARLGLRRNLKVEEITGQVTEARHRLAGGKRITNIVFMGMGEPLANYGALLEAIEVLTADWGLGFSTRRITVSTVGLLPQLPRLVAETGVNVAVSLSATTDEQRNRMMPVNRRYPIDQLLDTCRRLPIAQRRRITFEYVMLAGVNDSMEDARRLVRLLAGIRAKVNLIPFNDFPGSGFSSSKPETIVRFREALLAGGVHATVRASRGTDIQAACGQLAGGHLTAC
jgi:23S rRNA (adenine2503-C2)-methyltransferase